MELLYSEAGTGKLRVTARLERCGGDLSAVVTGGETPHVGAVALAQYEPERCSATVSVLTAYGHRDDAVALRFAKALAAAGRCNAAATVGIHVDGADADEITVLKENAELCLSAMLAELEEKK